ncbi:MAG: hypothetical protein DRP29_01990 [Thermodesulfobacteriota bacterium]|nr:MAG: hypothetical protein DRP29_01990 [Thermodesulfobacteriota bacterium]
MENNFEKDLEIEIPEPCDWVKVGRRLHAILGEPAKTAIIDVANAWYIKTQHVELLELKFIADREILITKALNQRYQLLNKNLKRLKFK